MKLERIITNFLDRSDTQRENSRTRARCKRKAAKLGITIEIERDACGNGYWLVGTESDDENFCTSWGEVEERLGKEYQTQVLRDCLNKAQ